MDKPKIAICIPSSDIWKAAMGMSLAVMMYKLGSIDIMSGLYNEQASDIPVGRNGLVKQARSGGATHIMWIDSDQTFPADGLERLLAHDKDVSGCFYSSRTPPWRIVGQLANEAAWDIGGIAPAIQMPGGFVLVKMSVYDKIGAIPYEEWFDPKEVSTVNPLGFISDDTVFTRRAMKVGCEVWCDIDLSKEIGHVGSTSSFIAQQ
jgi:hypothetical protein